MKKLIFLLTAFFSVLLFMGCTSTEPSGYIVDNHNYPEADYYNDEDYYDPIDADDDILDDDADEEPYPDGAVVEKEIKIQFVGDILLHPRYTGSVEIARTGANEFDFKPFLRDIKPFIDGDLAIANMETPVDVMGGNQDLSTFPWFNVPFEILDALVYTGFHHLIFGNNHIVDRGFDGMVASINNFNSVGLGQTGAYISLEDRDVPTIIDVDGIQVGIVAYADSLNGNDWKLTPEQHLFAVRRFRSHVLDDVAGMVKSANWLREQGAEVVVMSLHWGEEYVDYPSETQRLIARKLVEGGVDIIMGNHAHVVQPVEWHYREDGSRGFIMYSLGNFLADQTRLSPPIERTQFGKVVNVHISRDSQGQVSINEATVLPTLAMRDWQGDTLRFIDDISVLPVINGEVPEFVTNPGIRDWGRRAYDHLTRILGEDFIYRPN